MKKYLIIFIFLMFSNNIFAADSAVHYYEKGNNAYNNYDYFVAYEQFHKAISKNDNYFNPIFGLSKLLFAMEEYDKSLEYIERAEKLDKNNKELLNLKGRTLIGLNRFTDAKATFQYVLDLDRSNIEARLGLADLDVVSGAFDKATRGYKDIVNLVSNNKRALMSLVLVYDSQNYVEKSQKYVQTLLKTFPNDVDVRLLAAKHYKNIGNRDLAFKNGQIAINIQPKYFPAILFMASYYLDNSEADAAIEMLLPLTKNRDQRYIVWYLLGQSYVQNGEIESALEAFNKTLLIRSGDEISRIAMENLILDNRLYSSKYTKKLSLYRFEKGQSYMKRNFYDKSLNEYRRALQLDPMSKEIRFKLSNYYKKKNYNSAYYRRISDLAITYPSDKQITDSADIYKSYLADSVSNRWKIDQFDDLELSKNYFDVSIYFQQNLSNNLHYKIENYLLTYVKNQLNNSYRINSNYETRVVTSFSEAFENAKHGDSQYFLLFNIIESDRTAYLTADLYFSNSGVKAKSYKVTKTGNNMISEAVNLIISKIDNDLPLFGSIVKMDFDKAVVNIGKVDNVKVDDKLYICRKGSVTLSGTAFNKKYSDNDVIGTMTITNVDDFVSEGTIERRYFYDLVNEQDHVILEPENAKELSKSREVPWEVYKELLKLR